MLDGNLRAGAVRRVATVGTGPQYGLPIISIVDPKTGAPVKLYWWPGEAVLSGSAER
jgi:hypothetical protein